MRRAVANRLTPYLFMAPAAAIMLIALLYPLLYMMWGSFRDWDPTQTIGEAEFVGLRNYISLWNDPAFRESLSVTLIFAFTVVVVEMVLGVGLALLLDRNIRGMSLLRTLFIMPMMIAPVVVGLMWRYMYHPTVGVFNRTLEALGLPKIDWLGQNALMSVIIADIWQWTPFIFILSLAALQSLPRSALEAARIDGATAWQQIRYIKLPMMAPVLIVTALLRLIDAFKVLEVILVLTEGGPGLSTEIVALRISRTATEFRELGVAAAMSNYLLMLLMILTVAMFAFTRWQEIRAARAAAKIEQEEG
ncbi:MAG: sugar ABC transporter permease [Pseudomonadota bacterium]